MFGSRRSVFGFRHSVFGDWLSVSGRLVWWALPGWVGTVVEMAELNVAGMAFGIRRSLYGGSGGPVWVMDVSRVLWGLSCVAVMRCQWMARCGYGFVRCLFVWPVSGVWLGGIGLWLRCPSHLGIRGLRLLSLSMSSSILLSHRAGRLVDHHSAFHCRVRGHSVYSGHIYFHSLLESLHCLVGGQTGLGLGRGRLGPRFDSVVGLFAAHVCCFPLLST